MARHGGGSRPLGARERLAPRRERLGAFRQGVGERARRDGRIAGQHAAKAPGGIAPGAGDIDRQTERVGMAGGVEVVRLRRERRPELHDRFRSFSLGEGGGAEEEVIGGMDARAIVVAEADSGKRIGKDRIAGDRREAGHRFGEFGSALLGAADEETASPAAKRARRFRHRRGRGGGAIRLLRGRFITPRAAGRDRVECLRIGEERLAKG